MWAVLNYTKKLGDYLNKMFRSLSLCPAEQTLHNSAINWETSHGPHFKEHSDTSSEMILTSDTGDFCNSSSLLACTSAMEMYLC